MLYMSLNTYNIPTFVLMSLPSYQVSSMSDNNYSNSHLPRDFMTEKNKRTNKKQKNKQNSKAKQKKQKNKAKNNNNKNKTKGNKNIEIRCEHNFLTSNKRLRLFQLEKLENNKDVNRRTYNCLQNTTRKTYH